MSGVKPVVRDTAPDSCQLKVSPEAAGRRCARYVFACVFCCVAADVANLRCVHVYTLRCVRCVTCVGCVRGLVTGPWRSPASTPGLSGRSQLCRSSCLPWRAVHYNNSALHGTADKATCIVAIYQTGLESMQAAWLLHSVSGQRVGVVVD